MRFKPDRSGFLLQVYPSQVTENRGGFGTIFPNPTLALLTSGLFHRGRRKPYKPPSVTVRKKPCPHDPLRTESSEAHTQPENQALPCPAPEAVITRTPEQSPPPSPLAAIAMPHRSWFGAAPRAAVATCSAGSGSEFHWSMPARARGQNGLRTHPAAPTRAPPAVRRVRYSKRPRPAAHHGACPAEPSPGQASW